jgi:hypothetical protein
LILSLLIACGKPADQQATQTTNQPSTTPSQPEGAQNTQPPPQQQTPAQAQQNTGTEPAPQPGLKQGAEQRGKPLSAQAPSAAAKPSVITLPSGTVFTVRMGETLSSKTSKAGEPFTASVAEPVEVNGATVIPTGADATGHVTTAVPKGRFKGEAKLGIVLDTITINGRKYEVKTTSVNRTEKGKGKRTGAMIGGGAGLGALVGGLAGGGKGAAIGALAGAGAGTAGAAYTGNKDITIPVEAAMSFKLLEPVQLK